MAEDARERYIRESQRGTQFVHPLTFKREASKYPLDPVDTSLLNTRNTQNRWEEAGGSGAYPVVDPNWRMDQAPRVAPFRSDDAYNFINNPIKPGWLEAGIINPDLMEEEGWNNLKDVVPWLYPDDIPWHWMNPDLTLEEQQVWVNRGGLMSLV